MPSTKTGRVVYDRPKHLFNGKDVIRILDKLNFSYMSFDEAYQLAVELLGYEIRLLDSLIWWNPHDFPKYSGLLQNLTTLIDTFWTTARCLGQSYIDRLKGVLKIFTLRQ